MSTVVRLTRTPASTNEGQVLGGDVSKILSGAPTTQSAVQHHSNEMMHGTWSCQVGKWSHTQNGEEFVNLLEGEMTLESSDGETSTFVPGDNFVIPHGWDG